jgi:hypothetical protein
MANLAGIVQQLKKERDQAAKTVKRLDAALAALGEPSGGRRTGGGNRLSAAARVRIATAQRARWAKGQGCSEEDVVKRPCCFSHPGVRTGSKL